MSTLQAEQSDAERHVNLNREQPPRKAGAPLPLVRLGHSDYEEQQHPGYRADPSGRGSSGALPTEPEETINSTPLRVLKVGAQGSGSIKGSHYSGDAPSRKAPMKSPPVIGAAKSGSGRPSRPDAFSWQLLGSILKES